MKTTLIAFLLLFSSTLFAQNEVYFSDEKPQTISMQGLAASFQGSIIPDNSAGYALSLNYFYELRVMSKVTALFSGGFTGNFNYTDLQIEAEPRYYFSLTERTSAKRGGLNSGWFISLPLNISSPLISEYASFADYFNYKATLNIGYRYPLTNKWFLEGKAGGGLMRNGGNEDLTIYNATLKVAYTF